MKNKRHIQKKTIIGYLMVIPLVLLAGWLLQKSFWFSNEQTNQYSVEIHHQTPEPDEPLDIDIRLGDEALQLNLNGNAIRMKHQEALEQLSETLEKNLKQAVFHELNDGLKEWKKRDLPKLKRALKKLKKDLRQTIKDGVQKELVNIKHQKHLDKTERALINTIEELVEGLSID